LFYRAPYKYSYLLTYYLVQIVLKKDCKMYLDLQDTFLFCIQYKILHTK